MIASSIGTSFLKVYNEEKNTDYSAKEFFEEIFFPIFYDHEKYLQWITNSPLVQGMKKGQPPNKEERAEKLQKLITKIAEGETDASVAIGYPSSNILATTSGQVSNLSITFEEEEIYASWIGGGFGIGIKGGYSMYINEPKILMTLFEGWQYYRNFLEEDPKLRPNQIDTWNGQWLAHAFNKYFLEETPLANFNPFDTKKGVNEITTQNWVKIIFSLAQQFPNNQLLAYVFSLGNTNQTIGFIPIFLSKANRLIAMYKELFGENQYLKNAATIEEIFATKNSFYLAVQRGAIGIRAFEPRFVKELTWKKDKDISYKPNDELQVVSFQTYITWILAMLNNEQLHELSKEIVQLFLEYESNNERMKTGKAQALKQLLETKSADSFLDKLLDVIQEANKDEAEKLGKLIEPVNKLGKDNFTRFLILLKLQYTIAKK